MAGSAGVKCKSVYGDETRRTGEYTAVNMLRTKEHRYTQELVLLSVHCVIFEPSRRGVVLTYRLSLVIGSQ